MEPTSYSPAKVHAVTPAVQGALGAVAVVVAFTLGIFVGRPSDAGAARIAPQPAPVVPERITVQLEGLKSSQVECLEWVGQNFDKATAGLMSMVCNGKSN